MPLYKVTNRPFHIQGDDVVQLRDFFTFQIPFGVAGRAFLTAPQEVSIKASTIPEAGLGAFALTFIPRNTFLAIYEGEVILHKDFISDYAWTVSLLPLTARGSTLDVNKI